MKKEILHAKVLDFFMLKKIFQVTWIQPFS